MACYGNAIIIAAFAETGLCRVRCVPSTFIYYVFIHLNMIQSVRLCLDLKTELLSSSYVSCTVITAVRLGSPFFWVVAPHHWWLVSDVSRQRSGLVFKDWNVHSS